MKVHKVIKEKVKRDYFFAEGTLDINSDYFTKQIERGIQETNNVSHKTAVRGFMTSTEYFLNDMEFIKILQPLLDLIDENFNKSPVYFLEHAWGYKEGFANYTVEHSHEGCFLSGVIYLNNHTQKLIFPEIKKEILPKKGGFVLFSPFLLHKTKRNITEKFKYGLAFNWNINRYFDML